MISTNPREDRAIKVMAVTVVILTATLTALRACQMFRPNGALCAAFSAFRDKAIAVLEDRDCGKESCP